MKIKISLIFLLLLIWSFLLSGMNRVYEEKTGNQVTTHSFVIEKTESGFSIALESKTGDAVIKQKYEVDSNLATRSWAFENPEENTKVTAYREGNKIFMKGKSEGDPIDKTFKINELPWNQTFNIGLERFALSTEKTMKFWSIGTKGPGNMKITKFKVKRKGIETVAIRGKKVEAVYVTISLTGLLSIFWTGNYWYRKTDGRFIRYKGKGGPGIGMTIMELVSEGD